MIEECLNHQTPLVVSFIDYEQSFDLAGRRAQLKILFLYLKKGTSQCYSCKKMFFLGIRLRGLCVSCIGLSAMAILIVYILFQFDVIFKGFQAIVRNSKK